MSSALFAWEQPTPSYQHATAEAYAAFLREYLGETRSVPFYLRMREQFLLAYPDLRTWFEAPLTERMGACMERAITPFTWFIAPPTWHAPISTTWS